jgi:predicted esterase
MMRKSIGLGLLSLCLLPSSVLALPKEGLILFKDGFGVQGKIIELRDLFTDSASGAAFGIPAAGGLSLYIDDGVRRVFFSHTQLDRVLERKDKEKADRIVFVRSGPKSGTWGLFPGWALEDMTDWDMVKWRRSLTFDVGKGDKKVTMYQRIAAITNLQVQIQAETPYRLDASYFTREFSPEFIRTLLTNFMKEEKKIYKDKKEYEKRLDLARFFNEVGWHEEADKELASLETTYFDIKEKIAPLREVSKAALANILVGDLELAHKIGQHKQARKLLERYAKDELSALVLDRNKLLAEEIKGKYEGLKEKLDETAKALAELPSRSLDRAFWKRATDEILAGLNEDTLARLESFTTYAIQHLREVSDKRAPTQTAEQVLSLALTGWLQGNFAAEPEPKLARQLWEARELVRNYLLATPKERARILDSVSKSEEVHIDQVARMIQMLPPALASEKITSDIETRSISLTDSDGGDYLVQLPPEYHPYRSYPVLVLLNSHREKAEPMFKRFSDQAARNGYILVAPLWAKGGKSEYGYSEREHRVILDTIRDMRHAFNVDGDRVFLFGWEAGGDAAYDVGLSHPDQFAGVIAMNANPQYFPTRYVTNAQYLPLYVIEGERNAGKPKANRAMFKDLINNHYPAIYVEYKGRLSEWYSAEVETMFDWMNRKKRYQPMKQLGLPSPGSGRGEEFVTMRRGDNRFYWLTTDAIKDAHINTTSAWERGKQPATLQATIALGNELDIKAKGKEGGVEVTGAKVWTSIYVRSSGIGQFTLWITPAMHDFKRDIQVKWNGTPLGPPRKIQPNLAVLLEDYANMGDRQRLHYARISVP